MNSIKKNLPFGDKVFVARQEYNNLSYGTIVDCLDAGHVVIVDSSTNEPRRLNKSDRVINPKPSGFLNLFKKDPNKYIVYFINTKDICEKRSGNVECKNINIPELQDEKFFYYLTYKIKVESPLAFVKKMIDVNRYEYPESYFLDKIEGKLESIVKECISNVLTNYGKGYFYNNLSSTGEQIESKLSESFEKYGISISVEDIRVNEDSVTKEMREDTELRKYQKRMSKEE